LTCVAVLVATYTETCHRALTSDLVQYWSSSLPHTKLLLGVGQHLNKVLLESNRPTMILCFYVLL